MRKNINKIKESFINGMGRISKFWGFGRLMGQLYGLLYLSSEPMTLDQLAEGLMVSKGSVSTNVRALMRWGMVEKIWVKADRKDYYQAKTDFMEILTRVLQEREKKEFDSALKTVSECLANAGSLTKTEESKFLEQRLENMQVFFDFIDNAVFSTLSMLKGQME